MEKFVIQGGKSLSGTITPGGNKNEILPVLAAALLTKKPVTLHNVPKIKDVLVMLQIMEEIGSHVKWIDDHSVTITTAKLTTHQLPENLCQKLRASILFLGPILAREKRVILPPPGGDVIGRRRLDTHFHGLESLGAISTINDSFDLAAEHLQGTNIFLDEPSVTATENIVMAAVLARGITIIRNAAKEPHVTNLIRFLNTIGARIDGIGTSTLYITGVEKLHGGHFSISPDYLEVASFIGLAAVTNSDLRIKNCKREDMDMILLVFKKLGIHVQWADDDIIVPKNQPLEIKDDLMGAVPKIDDGPWPQFPTDLMSIAIIVATQAKGNILFFEKMFEGRMYFVDSLTSMGARIIPCDPHRIVVIGPSRLYGTRLDSPDVRAGMALLIAALVAKGESEIYNIHQIDRGYANIEQKLQELGAYIIREKI